MTEHRRRILKMLSECKINADQAERLLAALDREPARSARPETNGAARPAKYLRVMVDTDEPQDGVEGPTKVNIRVPMQLLRAGVRLSALIPPHARDEVNAKLPNLKSQLPQFQDLTKISGVVRDGKAYGIPFAFGSIGLIYDKDRVDPPPTSWNVLWDPKYKQKVIVSDTSEVGISMVAMSLGVKNPYHLSDEQFSQVKGRLSALRDNMLSYYSSLEESLQVYEAGNVDLIFSPWGEQAAGTFRKAGHNVGYAIPNEGASGWIDVWAMTKGVQNEELALAWINFVYEKHISPELTKRFSLGNTVTESPDFDYTNRLLWSEQVEDFTKRNDIWNAVKAGQ